MVLGNELRGRNSRVHVTRVLHTARIGNAYSVMFVNRMRESRVICYTGFTNIIHTFTRHWHHYLNVTKLGTFVVKDSFNCAFECLRLPSCVSVNLASSEGFDGKLWCEALSSDKYRNKADFRGSESSHHFSIKSPCSSSPCQNGGTCFANYRRDSFECICEEGFIGRFCETGARSCKEIYESNLFNTSQSATLRFDLSPISVYCHVGDLGCGNGAWTTVMKIDGTKRTFHYNSTYWSDERDFNTPGGNTGFDSEETKLPTYWRTPFTKICLGMKIDQKVNFIVINHHSSSLFSLIADGQYRATSLGRDTWKTLIGSQASLQNNCNIEGFNAIGGSVSHSKARIGYIANEQNDCSSCDSRIGIGTGGYSDDGNTCGNRASHNPDNGVKSIKVMGYILVQ
nr:uncharacterized protein LOC131792365 [Pocillopora verrucosa]